MTNTRWGKRRQAAVRIANTDKRSPMQRLLSQVDNGQVWVGYDQQWKTFFKAQALGYIDDFSRITELGKAKAA